MPTAMPEPQDGTRLTWVQHAQKGKKGCVYWRKGGGKHGEGWGGEGDRGTNFDRARRTSSFEDNLGTNHPGTKN